MNSLNELKKYIETKINNILENKKIIDQNQQLIAKLEVVYNLLTTNIYESINSNDFRSCLDSIFTDEDVETIIEKTNQAIIIIKDDKLVGVPQRLQAEEYLNKINTLMLKKIEGLKEDIIRKKSEVDYKISDYEEYSCLIKDGKIIRHLNEEELKKLFNFLKESTLDKNIVLDLTVLFSKDSIDYAEKLRKLRVAKEETIKKNNAKKIKEQIKEQNRNKVEEPKDEIKEVKFTLSEDENKIYYRMLEIINILTHDIDLTHDVLVDLLSDDYSLENRKSVYDSTDDKFNLILEDLKVNLIPNFENNKDTIITIFKYIITIFDEEYNKEREVEFVSQIADFSEEEKKEIEKYLEITSKELEHYNNLEEKDRNMIESIRNLIEENNDIKIEISSKFSLDYVEYITLIRRFYEVYSEYSENRSIEKEYIKSGLQDDINSCLISQMTEIRDILRRLNKQYELINGTKDNNDKTNTDGIAKQYTPERKTLFVFLPLSDGNYSIVDDQAEICETHKEVMKDVANGLHGFSVNDFYTYISSPETNNRNLLPDKKIKDYSEEVKPYRLRKVNARFAYTKLSLTASNQEKIKEAYGLEKADVLLIIGCSAKVSGSKDTYTEFNRRIAKEIDSIRYILNLFRTDFDDASFKAAAGLIDDSDKYCERLYKDPFKKLDDESLWR